MCIHRNHTDIYSCNKYIKVRVDFIHSRNFEILTLILIFKLVRRQDSYLTNFYYRNCSIIRSAWVVRMNEIFLYL